VEAEGVAGAMVAGGVAVEVVRATVAECRVAARAEV
jgi:hypothetical protein